MIARNALAAKKKDTAEFRRHTDLQAAAMLRASTMPLDARTETEILEVAAEMRLDRLEVIRLAIREWLAMRKSARFPADGGAPYQSVTPVSSDIPE